MKKAFINCDVTAVLQEIVGRHVKHYQSDFEVDKEIFAKAVQSSDPGNKYLLWLARPHGTHCLCKRDVYVSDTYAHNAWLFCHEQTSDPVVAYAVELDGIMDGVIKGNLYELDYSASCGHVKRKSLPASAVIVTHTDGTKASFKYRPDWRDIFKDSCVADAYIAPENTSAWQDTLSEIRTARHIARYAAGTLATLKFSPAGNGAAM